jgi:8-oxo-dGTP pyrophosphatase MutT (NUDIX family)
MPKPSDQAKWDYMFSDDMTFSQKIILFHPDLPNHFLILKRSSTSTNSGLWDLPGGNMLFGELHHESLLKEIKEETGITSVTNIKPTIVNTRWIEDSGIYRLFIGYKGNSLESNIILSPEHDEYRWVVLEEFLNLEAKDMLKEVTKASFANQ